MLRWKHEIINKHCTHQHARMYTLKRTRMHTHTRTQDTHACTRMQYLSFSSSSLRLSSSSLCLCFSITLTTPPEHSNKNTHTFCLFANKYLSFSPLLLYVSLPPPCVFVLLLASLTLPIACAPFAPSFFWQQISTLWEKEADKNRFHWKMKVLCV